MRTCALWCRTHLHRGALGQCLETCLGRRHGRALAALERVRGRAVPVLEAAAQVPRLSAEARGTVRCCLRVLCLGCGPCPYPCLCLRRFLCCLCAWCLVIRRSMEEGAARSGPRSGPPWVLLPAGYLFGASKISLWGSKIGATCGSRGMFRSQSPHSNFGYRGGVLFCLYLARYSGGSTLF